MLLSKSRIDLVVLENCVQMQNLAIKLCERELSALLLTEIAEYKMNRLNFVYLEVDL